MKERKSCHNAFAVLEDMTTNDIAVTSLENVVDHEETAVNDAETELEDDDDDGIEINLNEDEMN